MTKYAIEPDTRAFSRAARQSREDRRSTLDRVRKNRIRAKAKRMSARTVGETHESA